VIWGKLNIGSALRYMGLVCECDVGFLISFGVCCVIWSKFESVLFDFE